MKNNFQELETRIQELIEIRLVGLLPGREIESGIVRQLARAAQTSIENAQGTKDAPAVFTLIVHPNELERWQDARLLSALNETIQAVVREAGQKLAAPPTLSVAADPGVSEGEARVLASQKIEALETTDVITREYPPPTEENGIPENAFLIIEGRKVFPLNTAIINIGRRLENNLAIDDPRVSRTHAQIRAIKNRFVVFDLNSTGGTFVNGQRTNQTILYPGDVISLAGFSMVFGQDNPPPRLDLKDTGPLEDQTLDRTTAILRTSPEVRQKKK